MIYTETPLEEDVISLFENGSLHVNDMREFFKESVCDYLDDDPTHPEHEEAAYNIFDRWYRNLRKTLWTNGAKYVLVGAHHHPEKAEKEAATMYRIVYRNRSQARRKENRNED